MTSASKTPTAETSLPRRWALWVTDRGRWFFYLAALAVASVSCGTLATPDAGGPHYEMMPCPCTPRRGVQSGLSYDQAFIWAPATINVCWDSGGTAQQRAWVESAIDHTWNLAADVTLTGWSNCTNEPREVHLSISDHFEIHGLGNQLNHMTKGIVLGTIYNQQIELQSQATYAFGFVLGFTAEQDRYERPDSCTVGSAFPSFALTVLGPWDDHSVMNDCNVSPVHNGGLLSEGDIAGAQLVYGEPTACACE